jgi:predicted transcriptional regulator
MTKKTKHLSLTVSDELFNKVKILAKSYKNNNASQVIINALEEFVNKEENKNIIMKLEEVLKERAD